MKQAIKEYKFTDELLAEFAGRKDVIGKRLREFELVRSDDYFFELIYCLLTPQSSAVNAAKAVAALQGADWPNQECDISSLLHQDSFYIRFHHTKAKRLDEARRQAPEILNHLNNGASGVELREWLVGNVNGSRPCRASPSAPSRPSRTSYGRAFSG